MKRKTDTLRHLWVDDNSDSLWELPYREKLCAPSMTSFCVGEGDALASIDVNDQRFRHIHHLGGFSIARLDELPDLKYVRASLEDQQDFKVFNHNFSLISQIKIFNFSRLWTNSVRLIPSWNLCISPQRISTTSLCY